MPGTQPQISVARSRFPRFGHGTVLLLLTAVFAASSCARPPWNPGVVRAASPSANEPAESLRDGDGVVIAGDREWQDSGIDLAAREAVTVTATGTVAFRKQRLLNDHDPFEVGPNGTFLYADDVAVKPFPLPSAAGGPAPPYCLIGRIGEGPLFHVGANKSWIAKQSGRLFLRINDFDVSDNTGEFRVRITKPETVQPVAYEEEINPQAGGGKPLPKSSVIVFYVDGLRPDVVREMSAMGHLPYISKLFVQGGSWVENTFTVFPSDTITSNGTMWTGCFSDRHGLKGQVRFSRRSLFSESYLEPMGPNRSARLLSPQGLDRVVHNTQRSGIGLLDGQKAGEEWSRTHVTEVPPLYRHLRNGGADWATGVLPMMTEVPPILWTRSLVRHLPYFQIQKAWQCMDDANTDYTLRNLLSRETPVTIVWLPETDTVSHRMSRGQFGLTRRTIAQADTLIGKIVDELAAQDRLKSTYLFLVSDHGHHGGRVSHLSHFDIANELFYQSRKRTEGGKWIGGGLGLSVRQHRSWNRHPGDASRDFVFLDADSDGAARIFLPRKQFHSGQWMGKSQPADLLKYKIGEKLPAVNLVDYLAAWQSTDGQGRRDRPVDLVLMKLAENAVLISTHDRGQAVIDRKQNKHGRWEYRYRVVTNVRPAANGDVAFDVVTDPQTDPLGITQLAGVQFGQYYGERHWLNATAHSQYPDGVITLTRHILWQKDLKYREAEFAPDLVVTAKRGWYFGTKSSPGTMHGYPFPESMRATMFVHGPNIRRGARITQPSSMVDLTPTILDMVGHDFDPDEFDGDPMRAIYQPDAQAVVAGRPVFWNDFDLNAWRALNYQPVKPNSRQPWSVNHPDSPLDINNVLYNVLTVGDLSLLRILDDVLLPFRGRSKGLAENVEQMELSVMRSSRDWAADGMRLLNVSGVSLADYSPASMGNVKRVDGAIEWMQKRHKKLDGKIERKIGRKPPGSNLIHESVDSVQFAFWETLRFTHRLMAELLDETILNSLEDGTDRAINAFRSTPADVIVPQRIP